MVVKLLTEHHLEFLSLIGGCCGSSESTHVKLTTLLEISCTGSFFIFCFSRQIIQRGEGVRTNIENNRPHRPASDSLVASTWHPVMA